jgi:hypothetical protein
MQSLQKSEMERSKEAEMKLTITKERVLTIEASEGGYLLVEKIRYVPRGYTKGKWEEARIWMTAEELKAAASVVKA